MTDAATYTIRIPGTEILNDNRREGLEELISELREEGLDGEIAYRPPTGRGVSFVEATLVFLRDHATDAVSGVVLEETLKAIAKRSYKWAKARLQSRKSVRPQKVIIYGPDGSVLKEISVEPRDADPDTTSRFQEILDKERQERDE